MNFPAFNFFKHDKIYEKKYKKWDNFNNDMFINEFKRQGIFDKINCKEINYANINGK